MLGYYAHSHGFGHSNYAQIFSNVFSKECIVLTDSDFLFSSDTPVVHLPDENPDGNEFNRDTFKEPCSLHYAPVNMRKITQRNNLILKAILEYDIKFLIIDVSVEIAMLARVSSIPYAYVRLQGNRNDIPHISAYEGASVLLAFYPEEMESESTPPWIRRKTIYLGFLSKYSILDESTERPVEFFQNAKPNLLFLNGHGGSKEIKLNMLTKRFNLFSVGSIELSKSRSSVIHLGRVKSTRKFIEHADVILAACGSNTTSEILSLRKSFIAVPQQRPFQEQFRIASALHNLNWAVDLNRYSSITYALNDLFRLNEKWLPEVNLEKLQRFHQLLRALDFRIEFLMDSWEKILRTTIKNVAESELHSVSA